MVRGLQFRPRARFSDCVTVSPLTITKENSAAVQVAFDKRILEVSAKIGIHTDKSEETAFVSGAELRAYLESTGVKITEVDFSLVSV